LPAEYKREIKMNTAIILLCMSGKLGLANWGKKTGRGHFENIAVRRMF
jgi:hypothetical protein